MSKNPRHPSNKPKRKRAEPCSPSPMPLGKLPVGTIPPPRCQRCGAEAEQDDFGDYPNFHIDGPAECHCNKCGQCYILSR